MSFELDFSIVVKCSLLRVSRLSTFPLSEIHLLSTTSFWFFVVIDDSRFGFCGDRDVREQEYE